MIVQITRHQKRVKRIVIQSSGRMDQVTVPIMAVTQLAPTLVRNSIKSAQFKFLKRDG